ncbi:MAG: hypothetical protein ABSD89_15205, partial [Halobacteriota archaeon]
ASGCRASAGCRNGNVGAPTMALNCVGNTAAENKRVAGDELLREAPPPPCFCVCTGIIGLTGECLGCTGMIGVMGERWFKVES